MITKTNLKEQRIINTSLVIAKRTVANSSFVFQLAFVQMLG